MKILLRLSIPKLLLLSSISLIFTAALVLSGNYLSVRARGLFPTPPPVSTLLPDRTPAPELGSESPVKERPVYFVVGPSFARKILHWTKTDYSYSLNSLDPANGKPVQVEIWTRVGTNGIPTTTHAISTLPDGTFLQEVLQSPEETILILNNQYPVTSPDGLKRCKQHLPAYPDWMRQQVLPPFVDEAALKRFGFQKSREPHPELPTTVPLAGIQPLRAFGQGSKSQAWMLQQLENNKRNTKTLWVGADGRVLASQGRLTNKEGNVINEASSTYGSLEVYEASSVPPDTFAISQQALEECHE
ncbi:MAG: hypothetical protein EYC68_15485 [Chloroflexota bacterium]|nr:MAG: hypothetical protein EYC68_15485 [Chloroflexota bacterium]